MITSFLERLGLLSLLQLSREKHVSSDGVCQTPRGLGICYSRMMHGKTENTPLLGSNSKHLMTGPEGNSEICFPRISIKGICYIAKRGQTGGKQIVEQRSTFRGQQ